MNYIQHICKNKNCEHIFLDKDLGQWKEVQKWKYCPACVAAGSINPEVKPISEANKNHLEKMRLTKIQNINSVVLQNVI